MLYEVFSKHGRLWKRSNGVRYRIDTPDDVIRVLDQVRSETIRVIIWEQNPQTGEIARCPIGYVGTADRADGQALRCWLYRAKRWGDSAYECGMILSHNVVKIEAYYPNDGGVLYERTLH